MDTSLPQEWPALCLLIFALGVRHGFDADHLATIDGLTRFNARHRPRLARYCGTLFSLGHGAVVVTVALVVSSLSQRFGQVPAWLDGFGNLVSIFFLVALGLLNLRAVLNTAPGQVVQPVGLKSGLLGGLARVSNPWVVALVGALFAFSFDTMSQAALFALTALHFGGWQEALSLGLIFMAGMLVTDGINGMYISRLIRRTDQAALVASRVMGLVVSTTSLLVATYALARWLSPTVSEWGEGKELAFGAVVFGMVVGSFFLAMRLARRGADQSA